MPKIYILIILHMNRVRKKISLLLIVSILFLNFPLTLADNTSVTEEEKAKVETEILKLQSNIFNSSKNVFEKLTDEFEKYTNYEETWNTSFDLEFDEASMYWKWNASLDLKNYIAKTAWLDSEISGDISFKLDYAPIYWTWMNIDLSTFASMISKDSEIYLKLKDLDFKVTDENISQILDALKSEFSDNKFVKFPSDENTKNAMNMLKNFSLSNVLLEAENISKTPLLKAYKKDWNKYLLVPTKEACEKYFEVENKLNSTSSWYEPKSCSDTVYNSMVVKFIRTWNLYLGLWTNENTLGFYFEDDYDILDLSLVYDEDNINKFDLKVTEDLNSFTINYEKNNFLKSYLDADEWLTKFSFESELDKNNKFTQINSNFNFNNEFTWNFALKNKKISWMFYAKQKWYDYSSDNYEYKLKNVYAWKITWTLNENNLIKTLNTKIVWVSVKDKKALFIWKLNLNNWNINYSFKAWDDTTWKILINWTWKYDFNYFKLDSKYDFNSMYTWKMNYLVDTRNNKQNWKAYFDLNSTWKQILKFNLETYWTKIYKDDVKIEVPSDFKELDENMFWNLNY